MRRIETPFSGLARGFGDGFGATCDPLFESTEGVIAQTLVVLDQINLAQGKFVGQFSQLLRRIPERLQHRAD